jgi:hypothetical protein
MPSAFAIATLLLAIPPLAATPSPRGPAAAAAGREAQVQHCLVSLIEDVQVPALEAGALTSVAVVEGQYVSPGQLLAQLDDRQPRLDKLAAELQRDAALARTTLRCGGRRGVCRRQCGAGALVIDRKSRGASRSRKSRIEPPASVTSCRSSARRRVADECRRPQCGVVGRRRVVAVKPPLAGVVARCFTKKANGSGRRGGRSHSH